MASRDDKGHDEHQGSDSTGQDEREGGDVGPPARPLVIETDDPAIRSGLAYHPDWAGPDRTMVVETSPISEPVPYGAINPNLVSAPVESDRPRQGHPDAGNKKGSDRSQHGGGEGGKSKKDEGEKGRKGDGGQGRQARKDAPDSRSRRDDDRDRSGDRREEGRGRPAEKPSFLATWVIPGVVALVCGVVGAWGYWHFFGSSKSGDQKSSQKESDADREAQEDASPAKLHQVESERDTAAKERDQAQAAERAAQRAENETKAVLDFLAKKMLSAGRSGDGSLASTFWSEAEGKAKAKEMTLRQAVDMAESQVADTFDDRPVAEAGVREMLGLAYLNLGEPQRAIKQYERALVLRESSQGVSHPDTAACRNQLAVAYRRANRTTEAGRLFDRNPFSTARAAGLVVHGSMLLSENNPAEAELKLRESLAIWQKLQPDDWKTFETKALLGEALLAQKKYAEAESMLVSGYQGMKEREDMIPNQDKRRLSQTLEDLVKLYEAWGKPDEAARWRRELEKTK